MTWGLWDTGHSQLAGGGVKRVKAVSTAIGRSMAGSVGCSDWICSVAAKTGDTAQDGPVLWITLGKSGRKSAMLAVAANSLADFACRLRDLALGLWQQCAAEGRSGSGTRVSPAGRGNNREQLKEHGHGRHYYSPATR